MAATVYQYISRINCCSCHGYASLKMHNFSPVQESCISLLKQKLSFLKDSYPGQSLPIGVSKSARVLVGCWLHGKSGYLHTHIYLCRMTDAAAAAAAGEDEAGHCGPEAVIAPRACYLIHTIP